METGVVKIGGGDGNSPLQLLEEIAARHGRGESWVLVHGVSSRMDSLCRVSGIKPRSVMSPSGFRSRYVGDAEMELFESASLAETSRLCSLLGKLGVPAMPIDPVSTGSIIAKTKDCIRESSGEKVRILRGNRSGKVEDVDASRLDWMLKRGFLPVVPPLGRDMVTFRGVNIDGDRAAAAIAGKIGARILVLLTNVPGLLKDPDDERSLIREIRMGEWKEAEAAARGNMKRKVLACREALERGVPEAVISDSRVDLPLALAIKEGGTRFCRADFTGIAV